MPESKDANAEHARTAAQLEADVGGEHIAAVYAAALLGTTEKAGQTAAVLEEFGALMSGVLQRYPRLEAILAAALISHQEKAGILERLLAGRVSPLLLNFLKVLARHGRLDCLRAINRQVGLFYDKLRGRLHVEVTTAAPLGPELAQRVAARLRSVLGGQPVVARRTDPGLIGGAVIRIGDTLYDGSVANQLKVLREQMIQRSVHEIQSRRDRFRHPAGN